MVQARDEHTRCDLHWTWNCSICSARVNVTAPKSDTPRDENLMCPWCSQFHCGTCKIEALTRELAAAVAQRDEAQACIAKYGDAGAVAALRDANAARESAEAALAAERLSHETDQAHDREIIDRLRKEVAEGVALLDHWKFRYAGKVAQTDSLLTDTRAFLAAHTKP